MLSMKKIMLLLFERKQKIQKPFTIREELEDLREKGREQFKKLVDRGLQVPVVLL